MEEVPEASGPARLYSAMNRAFVALVIIAIVFIFWRGFAAESARRAMPLFGEVTLLEWEGRKCPFRLVSFADLDVVRPGELLILEGEPGAVVWRTVSRDQNRLRLERRRYGRTEEQDVKLPLAEGSPRFILVTPQQEKR